MARNRRAQASRASVSDALFAEETNTRGLSATWSGSGSGTLGGSFACPVRASQFPQRRVHRAASGGRRRTRCPSDACVGTAQAGTMSQRITLRARLVDLPRQLLITLVRAYRLLLSPWLGSSCRFEPTCSAYSLQALQRHGALAGSCLTLRRLVRCHPFCRGGHDPVPPVVPGLFSALLNHSAPNSTESNPPIAREKTTP